MKNNIKTFIKISGCLCISIILFILLIILLVILLEPNLPKSDYCIEDGDCKEGRVIIINDKEITLNKSTCTAQNWKWHEKSKTCKIPTGTFKVKKIIYE